MTSYSALGLPTQLDPDPLTSVDLAIHHGVEECVVLIPSLGEADGCNVISSLLYEYDDAIYLNFYYCYPSCGC